MTASNADVSPASRAGSAPRIRLLAIDVAGGLSVLGSYAWGVWAQPDAMGALWGNVPESVRPLYTVNMLLAAGGYFLFAPYIAFRLEPGTTRVGRFGYGIFGVLFLLILIPSALWLPATAALVESPTSRLLWLAIRLDLLLVAAGSLGLV